MKALLLGDLSPTEVTNPLFENGDVEALFADTISLFQESDVNFVNLECALTDHDKAIKKMGPPLKACANVAYTLKKIGVDYCGISNNHFFDYGIKGALDTIEVLKKAGIEYTGFGENLEKSRQDMVIEKNGEKLCIIAVCEHEYSVALEDRMGCRPYDEYDTMEDIRRAKETCDRVIVIYHGGKEHCQYPSPRLHKACRAMVKNGADVVLCQHSHCLACYEQYEGGHILYGQGNFHFNAPPFLTNQVKNGYTLPEKWNTAVAVKYDTLTNEIDFVPLIVKGSSTTLAQGEDANEIMDAFRQRNEELANGAWKEHWHSFCEGLSKLYIGAVTKAYNANSTEGDNEFFRAYLNCEAHMDVLLELMPTWNASNER